MLGSRALSAAVLGALASIIVPVNAATPDQWRTRSIYQLLTDRFARTDGSTTAACASGFEGFCGGTYQGIINHLPYIQGMGFDAIWVSPITQQVADGSRAYHGYSQTNLYGTNSNFGTDTDLINLAAALHARGMYLMIDLVVNHFGYDGDANSVDYSSFNPFNSQSYFHPVCWINDYTIQSEVELCWLGNEQYPLPDLNTTQTAVRNAYSTWIKSTISKYSIDGIRIDTVKHVEKPFWTGFQAAAGVYAVGEVADGDVDYVCPYQNYLDATLNYPMYYQLTDFFQSSSATSYNLVNQMNYLNEVCAHPSLLAPFSENHDIPRFPSLNSDITLAQNVIAFSLLADGIPIIYSGQEAHLNGGADPYNREAIWLTGYNTNSVLYLYIAKLNKLRKQAIAKAADFTTYQAIIIYNDDHHIAVRKGDNGSQIVAVYNNFGTSVTSVYTRTLSNTWYTAGSTVMEVVACTKVVVNSDSTLTATFNSGTAGLPLIYFPLTQLSGSGICGQ